MINKQQWGAKLKEFRTETGLSLASLAAEFSRFHMKLSEKEISELEEIHAEIYVSLDGAAIFHYENGKRKLPDRARLLFFIYYFKKQSVLDVEKANEWLKLAGLQELYRRECQILFGEETDQGALQMSGGGLSAAKNAHSIEDLDGAMQDRKVIYVPQSVTHVAIDRKLFPELREVLIVFLSLLLLVVVESLYGERLVGVFRSLIIPPTTPQIAELTPIPKATAVGMFVSPIKTATTDIRMTPPPPTIAPIQIETPVPSPAATRGSQLPLAGEIRVNMRDFARYVFVPGGDFPMGSVLVPDEQPEHTVTVAGFWISQTEVTNAQYARCVDAGGCTPPSSNNWRDPAQAYFPVTNVDWGQASTYAHWVGGHLPTEAQWEKAARGTDSRIFPWGNEATDDQRLNFNSSQGPVAVGNYPAGASPYGALDMAGNVEEWIADWYAPDAYTQEARDNPPGPATGIFRVVRGGSFNSSSAAVRSASRDRALPGTTFNSVGFRVCIPESELQ